MPCVTHDDAVAAVPSKRYDLRYAARTSANFFKPSVKAYRHSPCLMLLRPTGSLRCSPLDSLGPLSWLRRRS
jgi:hypothetical protein